MSNTIHTNNNAERDIPPIEQLMETLQKTIKFAWNIEGKMHKQSIYRWLSNFTGEALVAENSSEEEKTEAIMREQQLALFLLCNFVFYNENEVKYLTKLSFKKYIHAHCVKESMETLSARELNNLLDKTRFSYLGKPSESSSYLLYLFRQENYLAINMFDNIKKGDNIVLVDDFSISGSQAVGYLKEKINECGRDKNYYLLLMIATEDALCELNKIDGVTILPCISLSETSKTFSPESIAFSGYKSCYAEDAKKMCEHYGAKLTGDGSKTQPLGYGGSGYLFGAYYNIPNNTLPIIWSSSNNWKPIFKRQNKRYAKHDISSGGHYV